MKLHYYLTIVIAWLCSLSFVAAQNNNDTSGGYRQAVRLYHQSLAPETGLYNGIEYIDYAYTIQEGTPFFSYEPFASGSVVYDNMLYENIPLAFDLVKDEVVIWDAPHLHKIILNKNYISRFTASSYSFIRLTKDSAAASDMRTGFYELLYNGKTTVLKRETRSIQEELSSNPSLSKRYLTSRIDFYIKKDNAYHTVNSNAAMWSLFKEQQKGLKRELKKKKLKFSRDKDNTLIQAAAFYDADNK